MGQGECTAGKSGSIHLQEWAYLMEGEEGEGGPLMSCLVAAKLNAANLGAPPGLKPPLRFDIFTPQKDPSLLERSRSGATSTGCRRQRVL